MKKGLIIGVLALVLVAALGAAGYAYAQSDTPTDTTCPYYGQCSEDGWNRGPGMMGNAWNGDQVTERGDGLLHDYMINALAETFGLTPEEILAFHEDGITLSEWATDQGMTFDEFRSLMIEARTTAIEQAVLDGVISQEQADWMLNHSNRMGGNGSGGCGLYGSGAGSQGGGMRGPRWSTQP